MAVSRHPNGACSTLMAALTLCLLSIGTAQAELFWPHSRSWGWDDYGPFRSHHYRSWGGAIMSRSGKGANARTKAMNWSRSLSPWR